jgi:gliding motility-associatede transport system auxiliary component
MKTILKYSLKVLIILLILNLISKNYYHRFDLTQDKRYSLSKTTTALVTKIKQPLRIQIYLEGNFPLDFKRLQTETRQILQEFKSINNRVTFRFINPLSNKKLTRELIKKGFIPSRLTIQENGTLSEKAIFPWALVSYKGKEVKVNLLTDSQSATQEQQINNAISKLEYSFTDALSKILKTKKQSIAVLKGNGELNDIYLDSFLRQLVGSYNLARFTLDSVATNPQKTLNELLQYDLVLIAKPTESFSEAEKFTLDQYIMNKGKTLWLIDNVQADLDSLSQLQGEMLAYPRELNLTDMFFSYGVRIKYELVADLYSSKIRLASGKIGNKTQFQNFNWPYYPLITSRNTHLITKNINPVQLKFVTPIDTLKNGITKTILLRSSLLSKKLGTPRLISLDEINNQNTSDFKQGSQILAVLLEGTFKSVYKDRIKPFKFADIKDSSPQNAMLVISDGDIVANQIYQNKPIDLNTNYLTGEQFGNKDFLVNAVNYLMGAKGVLQLRSKTLKLRFLDKNKIVVEASFWKMLNVIAPLAILLLFGISFNYYRKLKYSRKL